MYGIFHVIEQKWFGKPDLFTDEEVETGLASATRQMILDKLKCPPIHVQILTYEEPKKQEPKKPNHEELK